MAADLVKIVDKVKEDLKAIYLQKPDATWSKPIVVFSKKSGGVCILDNIKDNNHAMEWVQANLGNDVESIVVGRMVVKHSEVLGSDGQPIVKEKGIMVMGRQVVTNRAYVSITPCLIHIDYRGDEFAEKQNKVFDPTLKGADVTKNVVDDVTGRKIARLQAKFGKEVVMDSRKGHVFMVDPLIEGVFPTPRGVEESKAESMNKPDVERIAKL